MILKTWLYWEGSLPEWIKECQSTVYLHSSNVQLINYEQFLKMQDSDQDIDLSNLCIAHRADFIRAFLLAKFGGLWIDSDCIVMKSLQPIAKYLDDYDFLGYRERSGEITNNFMAARIGSEIAQQYYQDVCKILRSNQPIEWLTLGSKALTFTVENSGVQWQELSVNQIQPICWSKPEVFFTKADYSSHQYHFDSNSFCYMVSGNMVRGYLNEHPQCDLLQEDTFFKFLLKESSKNHFNNKTDLMQT